MSELFSSIARVIPGSVEIKDRQFPARSDYERYFMKQQVITNGGELWLNDGLVVEVQCHWHNSGQNGCVFAQVIARTATNSAWRHIVVNQPMEYINDCDVHHNLDAEIQDAIDSPECEVLSLLFPQIVEPSQLVVLIRKLLTGRSVLLVGETAYDSMVTLALRVEIPSNHALSWLMGFGPFKFFPKTRQAPVTEIAIRVKPKPEKIFHRLNQDETAAHLADFPIEMPDATAERLWDASYKNTRDVLEREPDHFSAAKVTFSLPKHLWHE